MSDLHIDYDYLPGADNECNKFLCCRVDTGKAPTKEREAGKWGDYGHCDLPENTYLSLLDYIRDEMKPDVVMWLGDTIPHNVRTLDPTENVETIRRATNSIKKLLAISKYIQQLVTMTLTP